MISGCFFIPLLIYAFRVRGVLKRKIHFFKGKTRLGINNTTYSGNDANIGVEDGPDAVLEKNFLKVFGFPRTTNCIFPQPDRLHQGNYIQALFEEYEQFKTSINRHLRTGYTQVVVGGDHSISLPSVIAVLERAGDPKKVGYIHFDSHGDLNLYKESPTKNFHGMYLRILFDTFDISAVDRRVPYKIPSENLLVIGNVELDNGEENFFSTRKINCLDKQAANQTPKALVFIKDFMDRFVWLHVSVDIDVFDKKLAPATGVPAKNGLLFDKLQPVFQLISKHPNLSLDLSEVNPLKKGASRTVNLAQTVLSSLLGF